MKKSMGVLQSLSDADKFFITEKVKAKVDLAEIVKAVGKPEALVKEFAATIKVPRTKSQYEVARGKQTSEGKKTKIAVGTQATSEAGDEAAKQNRSASEAFAMKYADSMGKLKQDD